MKKLIIILGLILSFAISSNAEEMKYITGKITLSDGGNAQREVFVYYNRFQNSIDNLLKVVQTDAKGEFKVGIPSNLKYAELHLAAPGYAGYMTDYIEGDKNPRVEATLHPRAIPEKLDSVGVILVNSGAQIVEQFPIVDNKYAEIQFDLNDIKYEDIKMKDNDTITYTYFFNFSSITPAEDVEVFRYDNNGDYNAVTVHKNNILKLNLDLSKYKRSDELVKQDFTTGGWINSPVNQKYNEFLTFMPTEEVSGLSPEYYYYVLQKNNDAIKDLTSEVLEKRKQATITKYKRYITIVDSMLATTESSYLKDYLTITKLDLRNSADTANKWEDFYQVLTSINEIPVVYYSLFHSIVYKDEFKANPQKYIDILNKTFEKSKNKRNHNFLRYGLYVTLSRTELINNPKYLKIIKDSIEEIAKYDDLDEWPRTDIPKTLAQLEIKNMVYAPEFLFKSIDEKEHKLSDFKGKWVLLDFWGTWCGPCVMETPYLVAAYDKLGGEKFEMISISTDENIEIVEKFMKKKKMKWINTISLNGYAKGVIEQYGVNSFPTIMLVDPEGKFLKIDIEKLRGDSLIPTLEEKMGMR